MTDFTIKHFIMEFFRDRPNQVLHTSTVDEWVTAQYKEVHGKSPIGVSTDVNQLYHDGQLIRVGHGLYKYNPAR